MDVLGRAEVQSLVTLPLHLPWGAERIAEIKRQRGQIFGISEDAMGNIWFGNGRGACRYDGISFDSFR